MQLGLGVVAVAAGGEAGAVVDRAAAGRRAGVDVRATVATGVAAREAMAVGVAVRAASGVALGVTAPAVPRGEIGATAGRAGARSGSDPVTMIVMSGTARAAASPAAGSNQRRRALLSSRASLG
ncbi:hypothetical protein V6U81_19065 [Micromonospora sp. CPCC 205711]|uniref:hypothetical protein n=1 Tax=Micromonospora sp. CPCC 205547 TaxID=3122400 RepID=UPI002FF1BE7A